MNGRYLRSALIGLFCLLTLLIVFPALAGTANYNGTNVGGPQWDRPIGTGPSISGLGPVRYHSQIFSVDTTGAYDISSVQTYDGYLHVYASSFDPNNQTANLIAADDDGIGGIGTSNIDALNLTAGTTYYLITSAFEIGEEGTFTNTITGPGNITLGASAGSSSAVLPFGGDVFEPGDDRLNRSSKDRAAPVAVYCTAEEIMVLKVDVDTGRAIEHASIVISQEDVEAAGVPETANLLLAEGDGVQLWRLVGGRFQVNAFYQREPGKPWVFNWEGCDVFSAEHMAN